QVAHEKAVNTLNLLKSEIVEKEYEERKKQIKVFEAEIDDLLLLTPHSLQEIVQEGSILHHSVGSHRYLVQLKQGATTIVLIRKKEEPTMPNFTL
ncbi:PcfJ domain-containing protein, partial [Enterococcus faecalis]|uniref:PcfJ domain-containing protein n=1 Tax=Enterococcus faecalis TaxID=1351 RepID=UPI003CC53C38